MVVADRGFGCGCQLYSLLRKWLKGDDFHKDNNSSWSTTKPASKVTFVALAGTTFKY